MSKFDTTTAAAQRGDAITQRMKAHAESTSHAAEQQSAPDKIAQLTKMVGEVMKQNEEMQKRSDEVMKQNEEMQKKVEEMKNQGSKKRSVVDPNKPDLRKGQIPATLTNNLIAKLKAYKDKGYSLPDFMEQAIGQAVRSWESKHEKLTSFDVILPTERQDKASQELDF